MNKGELDKAIRRAHNIFDSWNITTGFVKEHTGYYYEILSLLEDAVHCGAQAATGDYKELEVEHKEPIQPRIDNNELIGNPSSYNNTFTYITYNPNKDDCIDSIVTGVFCKDEDDFSEFLQFNNILNNKDCTKKFLKVTTRIIIYTQDYVKHIFIALNSISACCGTGFDNLAMTDNFEFNPAYIDIVLNAIPSMRGRVLNDTRLHTLISKIVSENPY